MTPRSKSSTTVDFDCVWLPSSRQSPALCRIRTWLKVETGLWNRSPWRCEIPPHPPRGGSRPGQPERSTTDPKLNLPLLIQTLRLLFWCLSKVIHVFEPEKKDEGSKINSLKELPTPASTWVTSLFLIDSLNTFHSCLVCLSLLLVNLLSLYCRLVDVWNHFPFLSFLLLPFFSWLLSSVSLVVPCSISNSTTTVVFSHLPSDCNVSHVLAPIRFKGTPLYVLSNFNSREKTTQNLTCHCANVWN